MWLVRLFELVRDRFEEWQLKKLEESILEMELTLPYEEKVAKAEIELLDFETNRAEIGKRIALAETREVKARGRMQG